MTIVDNVHSTKSTKAVHAATFAPRCPRRTPLIAKSQAHAQVNPDGILIGSGGFQNGADSVGQACKQQAKIAVNCGRSGVAICFHCGCSPHAAGRGDCSGATNGKPTDVAPCRILKFINSRLPRPSGTIRGMNGLSLAHWLIIATIVLLLFTNRLPRIMRSLAERVEEAATKCQWCGRRMAPQDQACRHCRRPRIPPKSAAS